MQLIMLTHMLVLREMFYKMKTIINIKRNYNFSKKIHSKYKIFRDTKNLLYLIFFKNTFPAIINRTVFNYAFKMNNYYKFMCYIQNCIKDNCKYSDKNFYLKKNILIPEKNIHSFIKDSKFFLDHAFLLKNTSQNLFRNSKLKRQLHNIFANLLKDDILLIAPVNNFKANYRLRNFQICRINNRALNIKAKKYTHFASLRESSSYNLFNRKIQNITSNANYKAVKYNLRKNIQKLPTENPFILRPVNHKYYANTFNSDDINYKTVSNYYFHNKQNIEQEIRHIREMIIKTKETLKENNSQNYYKNLNTIIKQHIDINYLSDKVYQNIELRIRMERERRGI